MNEIQTFNNPKFGEIRTEDIDGKIYFCGKDAALALGYSNHNKALNDHCKKDGVTFCDLIDNLGRSQKAKFISEGNLYRLISSSNLPEAEEFEKWVFDENLDFTLLHNFVEQVSGTKHRIDYFLSIDMAKEISMEVLK